MEASSYRDQIEHVVPSLEEAEADHPRLMVQRLYFFGGMKKELWVPLSQPDKVIIEANPPRHGYSHMTWYTLNSYYLSRVMSLEQYKGILDECRKLGYRAYNLNRQENNFNQGSLFFHFSKGVWLLCVAAIILLVVGQLWFSLDSSFRMIVEWWFVACIGLLLIGGTYNFIAEPNPVIFTTFEKAFRRSLREYFDRVNKEQLKDGVHISMSTSKAFWLEILIPPSLRMPFVERRLQEHIDYLNTKGLSDKYYFATDDYHDLIEYGKRAMSSKSSLIGQSQISARKVKLSMVVPKRRSVQNSEESEESDSEIQFFNQTSSPKKSDSRPASRSSYREDSPSNGAIEIGPVQNLSRRQDTPGGTRPKKRVHFRPQLESSINTFSREVSNIISFPTSMSVERQRPADFERGAVSGLRNNGPVMMPKPMTKGDSLVVTTENMGTSHDMSSVQEDDEGEEEKSPSKTVQVDRMQNPFNPTSPKLPATSSSPAEPIGSSSPKKRTPDALAVHVRPSITPNSGSMQFDEGSSMQSPSLRRSWGKDPRAKAMIERMKRRK